MANSDRAIYGSGSDRRSTFPLGVVCSPPHPLTLSPSHPLTLSPSHPLTLSPSHPLTSLNV